MITEAIKTIALVAAIFVPAWFLLIRLPQLLDNDKIIDAMGSTSNQQFLIWKRSPAS